MLSQKSAKERGLDRGEVKVFKEIDRGAFSMKDTNRDGQFFSEVSKWTRKEIDNNKIKTDRRGGSKSMALKGRDVQMRRRKRQRPHLKETSRMKESGDNT